MRKVLLALLLAPTLAFGQYYGPVYNPAAVTITGGSISGLSPALPVASGGTGATSSTGTGSVVLSNSPTLVTPALGTPSSVTLTNATGLPIAGITGLGTGMATALGQAVTGSGSVVLSTNASLTTPNLDTPSAITLTHGTGLPVSTGLSGTGTGVTTALGNAVTGSGGIVLGTSPSITTPSFPGGVASVNGFSTAGNGVPVLVAKYDATAQQANISTSTVMYSVPSTGTGIYRIYVYSVVTQAATTSSTAPNVECFFTDNDTNVTETMFLGNTSTSNTVGTYTQSGGTMYPKPSTNITCGTSGYGSSGTTPMQFSLHVRMTYAN